MKSGNSLTLELFNFIGVFNMGRLKRVEKDKVIDDWLFEEDKSI